MTIKPYSDDELDELRSMRKRVTNPGARWVTKPGHRQRNFKLSGLDGGDAVHFEVYQRQNESDENDFSCGISYIPIGGRRLTLARYNGPSHPHGDIDYLPHIHRATASAIAAGKKSETEADETNRFTTLDGALRCLIQDFRLQGIAMPDPDEPKLAL